MAKEAQFDDVAETYDEGLEELLGYWGRDTQRFAEYKIAHIRHVIKSEPRTILDFGCGTGRGIKYIQKYFPEAEIYGCDVSKDSLAVAAKHIPRERLFINLSADSLKEIGIKFDLVILACVFHHIAPEDRAYWVQGIKNVTSKGGYVAVYEHNVLNPMTKKIVMDEKNPVDDINWMLSHDELLRLMGGKVCWEGYTLFSPIRFGGGTGV